MALDPKSIVDLLAPFEKEVITGCEIPLSKLPSFKSQQLVGKVLEQPFVIFRESNALDYWKIMPFQDGSYLCKMSFQLDFADIAPAERYDFFVEQGKIYCGHNLEDI
ncbi:MAG: hypothetical protein AABY01_03265 [Nanoarchaeota archaeon]